VRSACRHAATGVGATRYGRRVPAFIDAVLRFLNSPFGLVALGALVGVVGQVIAEKYRQSGERVNSARQLRQETYVSILRTVGELEVSCAEFVLAHHDARRTKDPKMVKQAASALTRIRALLDEANRVGAVADAVGSTDVSAPLRRIISNAMDLAHEDTVLPKNFIEHPLGRKMDDDGKLLRRVIGELLGARELDKKSLLARSRSNT
jgi:hypothetical protein